MTNKDINSYTSKEIAKLWAEKLKSGQYEQGQGKLCRIDSGKEKYCCLGVLCELYRDLGGNLSKENRVNFYSYGDSTGETLSFLPVRVIDWVQYEGLDETTYELADGLMEMNDVRGDSFSTIADYILEKFGG